VPLFHMIVVTVFAGLLGLSRSAQVSVVLPVALVVPGEEWVMPATLLPVHPESVRVTVSVCLAAVVLTPGEIVALPVTVHEIAGLGALAAMAEPDPTMTPMGSEMAPTSAMLTKRDDLDICPPCRTNGGIVCRMAPRRSSGRRQRFLTGLNEMTPVVSRGRRDRRGRP